MWGKTEDSSSEASSPAEASPSDEALMLGVQSNDRTALGVLFDRHCRMVRGIGYRVLRDRGEAEELMQDVFLYIQEKAVLFDAARGTVKTWLVQVAYHKAFDRRTYLKRRGFYDGTDLEEIEDNVKGTTDIEQELGNKFSGEQLRKAFGELPERQRMTLELFFFQGLSLRKVAQQLDQPLTNVRHHFYRGLKKLKKSATIANLREM